MMKVTHAWAVRYTLYQNVKGTAKPAHGLKCKVIDFKIEFHLIESTSKP